MCATNLPKIKYVMNYSKLFKFFAEKQFSDLELILYDDETEIVLNVHKIIICSMSDYFEKLLTFNDSDKKSEKIYVPNVYAMQDIIMSYYGQTTNSGNYLEWRHELETWKCLDFLSVNPKTDRLSNLVVPNYGLNTLINVALISNYSPDILNSVINCIGQQDHDIKIFPKEILKEMLIILKSDCIVSIKTDDNDYSTRPKNYNKTIDIININTGLLVKKIPCELNYVYDISCSQYHNHVAIGLIDYTIKIFDMATNSLICHTEPNKKYECIFDKNNHSNLINNYDGISVVRYSPNGKYLLCAERLSKNKNLFDLCEFKYPDYMECTEKGTLNLEELWSCYIKNVSYSPEGEKFFMCLNEIVGNGFIYSNKNFHNIEYGHIKFSCFTPDGKYLILADMNKIYILDANNYEKLCEYNFSTNAMNCSPCGKYLVLSLERKYPAELIHGYLNKKLKIIEIEIETGKIIKKFKTSCDHIVKINYTTDGSKIIISDRYNNVYVWNILEKEPCEKILISGIPAHKSISKSYIIKYTITKHIYSHLIEEIEEIEKINKHFE
ncbi:putative BTB/POZ domain-containing protein [Cotonvirus japonicus]|uniref:BTB/POZ domain-containing protein n=1 Tax=Cotonvirus japonicus TaxID=2811091 RepID=A0ABM7NRV9_9VIRU|nr:putative BTB/POZ domain-containing protein [Cotonvirus japonicus]BCS82836.1 putative BTB/POZ domain-containing protein [Cotonvirus japonicus]